MRKVRRVAWGYVNNLLNLMVIDISNAFRLQLYDVSFLDENRKFQLNVWLFSLFNIKDLVVLEFLDVWLIGLVFIFI